MEHHSHGHPGEAKPAADHTGASPGAREWTCPMHPQIVRNAPGHCPICGVALEPRVPAGVEDTSEVDAVCRRFRVSLALTLPLVVFAMGPHVGLIADALAALGPRTVRWLEVALATPVVVWGAWWYFVRGWRGALSRTPNMYTLIGLGVGVAYVYSLVAAFAPGIFPDAFRDAHGEVAVYFEPAAVIVTLVLLGEVLELRARGQTSAAIRALLDLAPTTARRVAAADPRFTVRYGGGEAIVTSSGRDDSRLFEVQVRDEGFLPFEGAGAIRRWSLALPKGTSQFDFDTISDVILHLRYSAREGGDDLRRDARSQWLAPSGASSNWRAPVVRYPLLLSCRVDFAAQWADSKSTGAPLHVQSDLALMLYWTNALGLTLRKVSTLTLPVLESDVADGLEAVERWPAITQPQPMRLALRPDGIGDIADRGPLVPGTEDVLPFLECGNG